MFSLDGFDEGDNLLEEPDGVAIATGGGVAFPQSDDEEISTDGECTLTFAIESFHTCSVSLQTAHFVMCRTCLLGAWPCLCR